MDLGIVLPNGVPGVRGDALVEWARRAEARGFSSVGVIGRLVYPSHEELVTLAAVAGATQRIRLLTTTLLAPLRDPVWLAKQAATLDSLSGGRLTLGLSVGMRPDDYEVAGVSHASRGDRLDAMLETMHALWSGRPPPGAGQPVCPPLPRGRIPLYFGAMSPTRKIARRIARWGDGYIAVGAPAMVAPIIDAIRDACAERGRTEPVRLISASYTALADPGEAERNITHYYGDFYPELGRAAAAAVIRTPEALRRVVEIYREAGFDEFNFSAATADPAEVDRIADALG